MNASPVQSNDDTAKLPAILEPIGTLLKAAVSATSIGTAIVSIINDEQTKNIEDTLRKHEEQIAMLKEIVVGELFVNKQKYLEELKATLQQAKDEPNEEKRRLYASYLTACCHPDNEDKGNRRILLDLVGKIDFTGVRILKDLTTLFNGKDAVEHFSSVFKSGLSKNDVLLQLDFLTSYRLIEQCTTEEIERFFSRYGNVKTRRPIARHYYKRTVLGDNLYKFISKGIIE